MKTGRFALNLRVLRLCSLPLITCLIVPFGQARGQDGIGIQLRKRVSVEDAGYRADRQEWLIKNEKQKSFEHIHNLPSVKNIFYF